MLQNYSEFIFSGRCTHMMYRYMYIAYRFCGQVVLSSTLQTWHFRSGCHFNSTWRWPDITCMSSSSGRDKLSWLMLTILGAYWGYIQTREKFCPNPLGIIFSIIGTLFSTLGGKVYSTEVGIILSCQKSRLVWNDLDFYEPPLQWWPQNCLKVTAFCCPLFIDLWSETIESGMEWYSTLQKNCPGNQE
jgi:hypothetical protein